MSSSKVKENNVYVYVYVYAYVYVYVYAWLYVCTHTCFSVCILPFLMSAYDASVLMPSTL